MSCGAERRAAAESTTDATNQVSGFQAAINQLLPWSSTAVLSSKCDRCGLEIEEYLVTGAVAARIMELANKTGGVE